MSEGNKTVCDSCEYRGIASFAVKYCRSCQEHLCKDCIDFHRSFKLTRGHLLVDTEDKQSLQLCRGIENIRMCPEHPSKPMEFYCFAHEELLCSLCLINSERHRECNKTIVDIESVGKSLIECNFPAKVKSKFQTSLSYAKDALQGMKKAEKESKADIEKLKSNIAQLRANLITTFDRKTKGILLKAGEISSDVDRRYSNTIEKLEHAVQTAESHNSLLESVLESKLPEDIFRCSIRMLEQIDNFELETKIGNGEGNLKQEIVIIKSDLLEQLEKSDKPLVKFIVKETNIERSVIDEIMKVPCDVKQQFISLCSVEDKKHKVPVETVKYKNIKPNSKNVETGSPNAISNSSDGIETDKYVHKSTDHQKTSTTKASKERIKLELEHNCCYSISAPDDKVSWFGGIVCLPNEGLVLSDFRHSRLLLLNKKYQIVSTKNLEYEPGHLNLLSEVCISVCLMKTSQILLVNVHQENLKEIKYIQTKFHPKCVQPLGDKLLVSCQNGNGEWNLSLITTLGEICQKIKLTRFFDGRRIAVQRLKRGKKSMQRIIQCCEVTNKLQCFEIDGTFVFDRDVANVASVLTDNKGYIFVIRHTGEIQVLDHEGELKWKMFRQPLNRATFAAFNKSMDKLFITLYKVPKLNVLNVKRSMME